MIIPLHLCLHRCRGVLVNETIETTDTVYFTHISPYQICYELSAIKDIALCLERVQSDWWLLNQSPDLRCAINGSVLPQNFRVRLNDGDTLEWGLSVWHINPEVHVEAKPEPPALNEVTENLIGLSATPLDLSWFDLRMRPLEEEGDLFDLVMPRHCDADRIGDMSVGDPLPSEPMSINDVDGEAIFKQLHQEYLHKLSSPHLIATQSDTRAHENILRSEVHPASPVHLEDLSRLSDPVTTLQDLVTGHLHIDEVFNGLDSLREMELFTEEDVPEILKLFAPGEQPTSQRAQTPPHLTRKEHHAVSVDSYYRITQYQNHTTEDVVDDKNAPNA